MSDNKPEPDYMAFMGHRLPPEIRQYGYEACKDMGLDAEKSHECTEKAANFYERDEPYKAQKSNLNFLDLTGHYRLMATLSAAWWENIGQYGEGEKAEGQYSSEDAAAELTVEQAWDKRIAYPETCGDCMGSGESGPDQICQTCEGAGATHK